MDYSENIEISSALFAFSFWSMLLLWLGMINIIFNAILSYIMCCLIFFVFSITYFSSKDKEWHIKVMTTFSVMLISPLLIYMSWLYSMYSLISRLEKAI